MTCGGQAYSAEDQIDETIIEPEHEYGTPSELVEQTLAPEEFRCPVCEFHEEGFDELELTDLDTEHLIESDREVEYEPEYGND